MQVRGAGDRARSLKVKGEEIWEMIQLVDWLNRDVGRDSVLDMVYCLCRRQSTGNAPWSAFSSWGRYFVIAPTKGS